MRTYKTRLRVNKGIEGQTIETRVENIVQNKEPINDGSPIIYTERKNGVLPAYDVRTDRFELAVEAMGQIAKSKVAKRSEERRVGKECLL